MLRFGSRQLVVQAQKQTSRAAATGKLAVSEQRPGAKPQQQRATKSLPSSRGARRSDPSSTLKPVKADTAGSQSTSQARRRIPPAVQNKAKQTAANTAAELVSTEQLLTITDGRRKLVLAPFAGQKGALKFTGDLRYTAGHGEARSWLKELLHLADSSPNPVVVGYDTESAVVWDRPGLQPTSLMQLCYHPARSRQPICLLLAISKLGITRQMCDILSHPNIIKVGMGITQDMFDLQRTHEAAATVQPQSLMDLDWLAYRCSLHKPDPSAEARAQQMAALGIKTFPRPQSWGLAGLLEAVSEFTLSKSKRITRSNWARIPLTSDQVAYAAGDAYAGLIVYHSLQLLWLQQRHSSSSGSSSSGGGLGPAASAAAAAAVPGVQQQAAQQHLMSFTLQLPQLTSAAFWGSYQPAVLLQQQWEQDVLRPGFQACQAGLERSIASAAAKAELLEAGDWQAGGQHDIDVCYTAATASWGEVA